MNSKLCQIFSILRFPLAVLIVFYHTYASQINISGELLGSQNNHIYKIIGETISRGIAESVVPLFFFMSGYLFFKEIQFTKELYILKLKKRARTLLLPYLFWNLWVIAFMFIYQYIGNKVGFVFTGKMISDYSAKEILLSFWDCGKGNYPICFQLWFVRDLIIISLISPLLYYLITKFRYYFIFILGLLYLLSLYPKMVPGIPGVFYFSLGASYLLLSSDYINGFKSNMTKIFIFYPLLLIATIGWLNFVSNDKNNILYCLTTLFGVLFWLNLLMRYEHTNKAFKACIALAPTSFFIYAFHEPVQALIKKVCYMIVKPNHDLHMTFLYFFVPILTILFGLGIYWIMKNYTPRILRSITGR